ncbi:hypothetical protein DRE_00750 [Drechslerella stenobrocha 248]|uniref:FAD-binding domain-containing protein n=1 Tax=Drechslerella stenobrocha 248 TaxID=1043628 RepID=W7HMU6_9PEZI|nr:hypothetical protein DRE_00750 [Drechslerella stenobrocha 248]
MPRSVIVVGGSLAGLMHALQLKRQGNNVTILEQDPSSERSSNEAGIAFRAYCEEFLTKYDDTGVTVCVPISRTRIGWRTRPQLLSFALSMRLTSWGHLYRVLRANFDGYASKAVPVPPPSRPGDGRGQYLVGKRAVGLSYNEQSGIVTVRYVDFSTGKEEQMTADLVIGADGIHSTVRNLIGVHTVKEYAGYVAWRGTVPEKLLSQETLEYFTSCVNANTMKRSYAITYVIPTDDGNFEPGERLINFVWYYNIAEGSPEMDRVLTDINGVHHRNTVPRGLVQPEEWARVRETMLPHMAAPFAELVSKNDSPFVTKIHDARITSPPTCHNGRVILVGDALTTLRPHSGSASEQAAFHCLRLPRVWDLETDLKDWVTQVDFYTHRLYLLSRAIGELGQGSAFSFFKSLFSYVACLLSALWYGKPKPSSR